MSKIYWSWKNIPGSLSRIWQNITRGWNDSDCWDLFNNISDYIIPRLKRLKETTQGHPSFDDLHDNDNFDEGMDRWKSILDKMLFSFECISKDNEDLDELMPKCEYEFIDDPVRPGYSHMKNIFKNEEDEKTYKYKLEVYRNVYNGRQLRIQEGLDLFAKYFQSLWD